MTQFTAGRMAQMLKATLEGDTNAIITRPSKIEEAGEGSITFLANLKYEQYFYDNQPTAVIVDRKFKPSKPVTSTLLRVDNPYMAVAKVLHIFNTTNAPKKGISCHSRKGRRCKIGKGCYIGHYAVLANNVTIGDNVKIYPNVYVGDNVTIGDNTILYSGVKLYPDVQIGRNCILHSGVVVGADGFGFVPTDDGSYNKIDQIGNVVVEDDVEIGANSCVDRATMGSTIIHRGVKIDNLCQVGHNVQVGENTVMCSQSGIAGSSKVGARCLLTGQVGIVGHVEVGDDVKIGAQSGVTKNVPSGATIVGSPATEASRQKRNFAIMRNMEALLNRIVALEKRTASQNDNQ
ncbi:MAG: UDP-3-O-(3-hydroxymyristoyl)glucosamine N-acyltransferase [Bacteroidales bacterium]|nr:UDP-3-O-(3-hydroxymyristoyl)glucosamine N-acyltransferase [Bacteroidales bacterium]